MKSILFVGVIFAAAPAVVAQTVNYVSTVQSTSGLLGYWRFSSGTQANSSVNAYTGSFVGNAQLSSSGAGPSLAGDPTNTALVLDGNGDYVTTSLTGNITSAGSVVAWINLSVQPSTAGTPFQITAQPLAGDDFDFQINTDNYLHFFTDSSSSTVYSTAFQLNTWYFVAGTFDDTTHVRSLYVNGTLVATSAPTGAPHSLNTNALWIGNNQVWGPRYFNGSLDEVAVFNRALTATEISNLYAAAIPEPSTVALASGGLALAAAVIVRRRRALSPCRCPSEN